MITFNNIGYMGRLGNQMFQMASTIGIARRLGLDPVFPLENFGSQSPYSHTGCDLLQCFNIPEAFIKPMSDIQINYIYSESVFNYNQEISDIPDYTALSGYFQTEKYFEHIESEIREIFTFRDSIESIAESMDINTNNSVSIHIRRGDYLSSPDHHPTQDAEYYKRSISEFGSDKIFYIFSDDIEWCRQIFTGSNFRFIDSGNPYADLCIMSKLKNHIIANSSFSWWGAWLSGKDSKVVAPIRWFGPALANKDTSDIYCKNWIKI